jgi:hypothetical protein
VRQRRAAARETEPTADATEPDEADPNAGEPPDPDRVESESASAIN